MLGTNAGARGSFLREPIQLPDATPDSISTCIARLTMGRKFTIFLRAVGPVVSELYANHSKKVLAMWKTRGRKRGR